MVSATTTTASWSDRGGGGDEEDGLDRERRGGDGGGCGSEGGESASVAGMVSWSHGERRVEELKTKIRYRRLKLTSSFEKQLEKRKKQLEEKVSQLQYMAEDCQKWKMTDMVEARRGMEVSMLKYRLAKEIGQEARCVLDDMLDNIRPYTMDPHGLEEAYWRYFDGRGEDLEILEEERREAEEKLAHAGFNLRPLSEDRDDLDDGLGSGMCDEDEQQILDEVERLQDETHQLIKQLEIKRAQLRALRGSSRPSSRSNSRTGSSSGVASSRSR